jgi:hypothetical protein
MSETKHRTYTEHTNILKIDIAVLTLTGKMIENEVTTVTIYRAYCNVNEMETRPRRAKGRKVLVERM